MSYDIKAVEDFIWNADPADDGWYAWAWEDVGPIVEGDEFVVQFLPDDSKNGREGGGEDIHLVFRVSWGDGTVRHFQKNGYYASYDGSNWDGDFFEVEPVEVQRTEYKAVKR